MIKRNGWIPQPISPLNHAIELHLDLNIPSKEINQSILIYTLMMKAFAHVVEHILHHQLQHIQTHHQTHQNHTQHNPPIYCNSKLPTTHHHHIKHKRDQCTQEQVPQHQNRRIQPFPLQQRMALLYCPQSIHWLQHGHNACQLPH